MADVSVGYDHRLGGTHGPLAVVIAMCAWVPDVYNIAVGICRLAARAIKPRPSQNYIRLHPVASRSHHHIHRPARCITAAKHGHHPVLRVDTNCIGCIVRCPGARLAKRPESLQRQLATALAEATTPNLLGSIRWEQSYPNHPKIFRE